MKTKNDDKRRGGRGKGGTKRWRNRVDKDDANIESIYQFVIL
jgi:hypothetical protein